MNGESRVRTGGTPTHSLLAGNLVREMGNGLKGSGCRVYPSDLILQLAPEGEIVSPDVSVICGEVQTSLKRKDFVRNPILIVEVLSKDRADYDRSEKFAKYRGIESLKEYVLVDQYSSRVAIFFRTASGFWDIRSYPCLEERVIFQSIGIEVEMQEIYAGVEF